jgi:hypothetical protein
MKYRRMTRSRKARKSGKKGTRRQRGGATIKLSDAVKHLQDIQKKHGNLDVYRAVYERGESNLEDVKEIVVSDQGGWNKVLIE